MILSLKSLLCACVGLSLMSCVGVRGAFKEGMMMMAADNQMMLIRKDPPSFGFKRLMAQMQDYPDIAHFISKKGIPDFIVEMNSPGRHYVIFYYLSRRQAYICRTEIGHKHSTQFAGAYPITKKEYRILSEFQQSVAKAQPAR